MKAVKTEMVKMHKIIGKALKGIPGVSFFLDVIFHYSDNNHHNRSQVTLWFGHTFSKTVAGGEDIKWLAEQARKTALEYMAKLQEIAKDAKERKK